MVSHCSGFEPSLRSADKWLVPLASLHMGIARQLLVVEKCMRERVWAAANVQLETLTIDTDTTVHTLFGNQMGARKGYNPKNKCKKSYQPIPSFIAETREYAAGALRNGDRPDGREIAAHPDAVAARMRVKSLVA